MFVSPWTMTVHAPARHRTAKVRVARWPVYPPLTTNLRALRKGRQRPRFERLLCALHGIPQRLGRSYWPVSSAAPAVVGWPLSVPFVLARSTPAGSPLAPTSLARGDRPARARPACPGIRRTSRRPHQSETGEPHGHPIPHRPDQRQPPEWHRPARLPRHRPAHLQTPRLQEQGGHQPRRNAGTCAPPCLKRRATSCRRRCAYRKKLAGDFLRQRCRDERVRERAQKRQDAIDAAAIDEFAAKPERGHKASILDCGMAVRCLCPQRPIARPCQTRRRKKPRPGDGRP